MKTSVKLSSALFGVLIAVNLGGSNLHQNKMVIISDPILEAKIGEINLDKDIQVMSKQIQKDFDLEWKRYIRQQRIDQLQADLTCLADNIYHEAGFEPEEGRVAVAVVVVNRLKDPAYPKTVCGVVYERHLNPKNRKITCQFTWTCKPRGWKAKSIYEEAREIARQVLIKHEQLDELEGVTLYHAVYVHPDWADRVTLVTQIGQHIFYKGQ